MENSDFLRIDSPLFKQKISNNTIYFFLKNQHDYSIYKDVYNKIINEQNENYSSIYLKYNYITDIDCLTQLNINFNKIKKMIIEPSINNIPNEDNNYIFKTLFSFNNIKNNLIYLRIYLNFSKELKKIFGIKTDYKVNSGLFEEINNMKALKYLDIGSINFNKKIYIRLPNLKSLYCVECAKLNLSDIFCPKLVKLRYAENNISDINALTSDNFKELKELNLRNNNISNINVLEKVKFKKLEGLGLHYNKISNINVLKNVNFKKLKILNLSHNNISDINVLGKVKFELLEDLFLDNNKISNIDVLQDVNFKELNYLNLSCNNISDITVLEKVKFGKLEYLYFTGNKISNIDVLKNVNFNKLRILHFSFNDITDISVLELIKLRKLERLNLVGNNIEKTLNIGSLTFKTNLKLY